VKNHKFIKMKTKNILLLTLVSFSTTFCTIKESGENVKPLYAKTAKIDQVDDYFGTKVADPYRWLEVSDSSAVADWVEAQNEVTFGYLEKIPYRQKIKNRLKELWNYPRYSPPVKAGNHYFFFKNDGLQNQSVFYMQKDLDSEPEILLDPNLLSEDGTVSLTNTSISNDGKLLGYGIAKGGSDWNEFFVLNVDSKKPLDDHLKWIKFSDIAWYKDGFFYSRYDAPKKGKELESKNEFHKLYYHKIGTSQDKDLLIYEDKEHPLRNVYANTTEDEHFLILYISKGASEKNALYFMDLLKDPNLSDPGKEIMPIVDDFENHYSVIGNIDQKLIVKTNLNAPKYRVILINPYPPKQENWKELIPEDELVIHKISYAGQKLFVNYMMNACSRVMVYERKRYIAFYKVDEILFPALGSANGFKGKKDGRFVFYSFTSFVIPTTIYRYDLKTKQTTLFKRPKIDFGESDYQTTQTFYKSKDGTEIPIFIVHKKGLELNGNNPTYLYGYGGFNISITPRFQLHLLPFLENGGVYAVPNLRGGGEYGEEWHKGGMLLNKQNVFDDFIAAAEYLIEQKYTSPDKLAISGRSNGGLLVGACMTQRPDLYKVALPGVGVMDMLRFHKFTIGWAWVSEYGSSEDSTQFFNLYSFSPIHNINGNVNYPATLVTTADHDDRVVPAHSFKFISTLQEKQAGAAPVLIRIDTKAGHGAGKPTSKRIDEWADVLSFVFYNLEMKQ